MKKGTISKKRKPIRRKKGKEPPREPPGPPGSSPQAKRRKSWADTAIDAAIGDRIRRVRVEIADMDQRTFAAVLGVSPPAVAQWELGKGCQRANLDKIVAEFDVSRDWLHTGLGGPTLSEIFAEMRMLPPDAYEEVAKFVRAQTSKLTGGTKDNDDD